MSFSNDELKFTVCDVCGHEKECFIESESGEEMAVCQECLNIVECD